jgi:single-strand DNA-binding protein
MTTYNRVILTGRVAKPPQRRYRPDGSPVIQFPLELNHPEGHPSKGDRSLIQIVAFGKMAEFELDFFQSGQHLLVEGQLKQRHWQTPEGKHRTRTEVIATDLRRVEEEDPTACLPCLRQAGDKQDESK